MAGDKSTSHILQSLVANSLIAVAKGIGTVLTGSGAMLAETLHSLADCGNQLLLLMGVHKSRKPPTASHPLGYGRLLYFWSFMVALLLFTGGGVFSLYEGTHKLGHPEPMGDLTIAMVILAISLVIEAWATYKNIVELNKRRGSKPFFRYLSASKDSDLVVVFGENSAASSPRPGAGRPPHGDGRPATPSGTASAPSPSASCWSAWPCSSPTRSSR